MKKVIMIALSTVLLSMQSCIVFHISDSYADAHLYSAGSGSTSAEINQIQVDWTCGNIVIDYGEDATLTWEEVIKRGYSDCHTQMRYRVNGNCLQIRYCESGSWRTGCALEKELHITLPKNAVYQQVQIDAVSGNITADIDATQVQIDSVSGNIWLRDLLPAEQIQVESVSGNVEIYQPNNAPFKVDFESTSGNFSTDFQGTYSGHTFRFGQGGTDMDIETVSGNIAIYANK